MPYTADDSKSINFRLWNQGSSVFNFVIDGQNVDVNLKPVYWEDPVDVSLSGKKRSNIRGLDATISINFNASLEPVFIEQLLEGLLNLIDPDYRLEISLDFSQYIEVYPVDGINVLMQYRDTVRTGGPNAVIPTLEFEGAEYFTDVDTFLSP